MPAKLASNPKVAFAHVLRGFAATLVLFLHLQEAAAAWHRKFTAPASVPDALAASDNSFNIVDILSHLNQGKLGVGLFFLISGFVIPFALCRQTRTSFAIARFFRLWPTYAVGFSVGVLTLSLYGLAIERPFPYSFSEITAHYFLIFRDLLSYRNIDLIVWTLEVEVRFYILCILIAPVLRAANPKGLLIVGLFLALFSLGTNLVAQNMNAAPFNFYFLERSSTAIIFMLTGVVYNFAFRQKISRSVACALILSFFVMFAALQFTGKPRLDVLTSYTVALALFALAFRFQNHFRNEGPLGWVGSISYSLYVIHPLLGATVLQALLSSGMTTFVAYVCTLIIVVGSAGLLHRWVEVPTHEAGRRLAKRFDGRKPLGHSTRRRPFGEIVVNDLRPKRRQAQS